MLWLCTSGTCRYCAAWDRSWKKTLQFVPRIWYLFYRHHEIQILSNSELLQSGANSWNWNQVFSLHLFLSLIPVILLSPGNKSRVMACILFPIYSLLLCLLQGPWPICFSNSSKHLTQKIPRGRMITHFSKVACLSIQIILHNLKILGIINVTKHTFQNSGIFFSLLICCNFH